MSFFCCKILQVGTDGETIDCSLEFSTDFGDFDVERLFSAVCRIDLVGVDETLAPYKRYTI